MKDYKLYFYCLLTGIIVFMLCTCGKTTVYFGPDREKYSQADIGLLTNWGGN